MARIYKTMMKQVNKLGKTNDTIHEWEKILLDHPLNKLKFFDILIFVCIYAGVFLLGLMITVSIVN